MQLYITDTGMLGDCGSKDNVVVAIVTIFEHIVVEVREEEVHHGELNVSQLIEKLLFVSKKEGFEDLHTVSPLLYYI